MDTDAKISNSQLATEKRNHCARKRDNKMNEKTEGRIFTIVDKAPEFVLPMPAFPIEPQEQFNQRFVKLFGGMSTLNNNKLNKI